MRGVGRKAGLLLGVSTLAGCTQMRPLSTPPRPPAGTTASAHLDTPAGLVRLGDDVRKQGDLGGALTIYQAAVLHDRRDLTALSRVGVTSMALNEPLRAQQAFQAVLAQDGNNLDAQYGLTMALLALHRVDDALAILSRIGKDTTDPRLVRILGVALDLAGRSTEAQAVYRRSLASNPTDGDLRGDLALSLAVSGDYGPALSESEATIQGVVPDPKQLANNVLLLALAGKQGEARRRGDALLGSERTTAVLERAALVKDAPDAKSRATVLGLLVQ